MLKAVYDTNIIVSAAIHKNRLPALILSLALQGKLRLFVSEELLCEYELALKRPKFKLDETEIDALIRLIGEKAVPVKPTTKISKIKKDLKDNKVLECALAGKVDFIVTGDKKHFSFGNFKKTKIVNPQGFATHFIAES